VGIGTGHIGGEVMSNTAKPANMPGQPHSNLKSRIDHDKSHRPTEHYVKPAFKATTMRFGPSSPADPKADCQLNGLLE
jgi:hypothetical protein